MNRNDAPVNLELPPNQCTKDAQPPQKTPSEREADGIQTPSLHRGLQAAIDKMTQDTWDHSRGSNESHMALFTDLQKSPLQNPGGVESTRGCKISPSAQQSQVDTAIKTVEGTEIQVDEKVEGNDVGKLLVQSDSVAPNEKIVEMETDSAALHMIEHTETEKTKDKDTDVITVDASNKETQKNEHILKMGEETSSELQNLRSTTFEPAIPLLTKTPETTLNLSKLQMKDFQEIQKPVTKVISVAELLRSQIKALDSTPVNSVTTIPVHADCVQDPTTTSTGTCEELKDDGIKCRPEVKKSMPSSTDDTPPRNIKETLMEVYHQLNETDQEQTSPPVQALQKPRISPPISVVDTGASTLVPPKYSPVVSLSGRENVPPATSTEELTSSLTSISNLSGTVSQDPGTPLTVTGIKARGLESNITVLGHVKNEPVQGRDMGFIQKLTPDIKLDRKTERGITETLLDQYKMDKIKTSSLQSVQKFPIKSALGTDTQENNLQLIQQDSSMVEEFSRTDSLANPTPEASPLLKKRNCISPIPSATPQELASGARRKILIPKTKPEEASEVTSPVDNQTQKKEVSTQISKLSATPVTLSTSPSLSRRSPLLQPPGEQTSPAERRSPLLSRRRMASETQLPSQQPNEEIHTPKTEGKPVEKQKHDPFKGKTAFVFEQYF